jgi:signal transduction histidine kinase
MGVLQKLPTFVTVCVLVMIFACLKRHTRCARLTLWSVGWTLVFTHFLAQLLEPAGGANPFLLAVDAGALQASAVVFLVSVSSVVEDRAKRTFLLLALLVPSVAYAALNAYGVQSRWPYVLCLIACFSGAGALMSSFQRRLSLYAVAVTLLCAFACAWATRAALNGSFREGTDVILGVGFALSGIFLCRKYWGVSPAVLTISAGFFCWGAVFPTLFLLDHFAPHLNIPRALWETPKLFVAFGMILAVVEDKSEVVVGMQRRAEALNRQLERFSAITSRLLSGAAPDEICPDIASAITETSSFRAVLIHTESAEGTLRIAGSSGLQQPLLNLQNHSLEWTADHIQTLCAQAQIVGRSTFVLNLNAVLKNGEVELLIPLRSVAGSCLGSITLAAPPDPGETYTYELAHIESLAADLAVAVEMKSLHTQLVWSEKLAALGQLIAGVAHELNNPLTAIMGFGELISDAVTSARTRDQLTRLMSETRRMKRITDNLLRFSRQSSGDSSAAHLFPVVQEVLTLCEYYTRKSDVRIEIDVARDLPSLAMNEDEIKQILLNLFNNSCDALHGHPGARRITIRAHQSGSRAVIQIEDTGPGFSNLTRAITPFYTTKPAGKGTGLGLSVCYGIAKKRGGDLRIENVEPHGGLVTLEIPVVPAVETRSPLVLVAHAHASS